MRRVVVTGMGVISPIGNTIADLTQSLREGKSAVNYIKSFDTSDLKAKLACECEFDAEAYFNKKDIRRMDRVNLLGIAAAREAIKDSGIDLSEYEPIKTGIIVSSGIGGLNTIQKEAFKAAEGGFSKIGPFFIPMAIANMTAALIAIETGIHGYVGTPVTACASSANAILDAYRNIKHGYSDIILAGGSEASINGLGIGGFSSMKALSESDDINRASIPFDKERNGFVMGEGSAMLVLEDLETAKKRKARIYGEIVGAQMTCDASHITAPDADARWAALAMQKAVEESGHSLDEVDYINAHGTSTPLNDKSETKAIKNVFGDRAYNINISSSKSMTGHMLGAAGALEVIISLIAIQNKFVPPTVNYQIKDEDCDLNITANKAIDREINLALSNSLGFGGHNVSLAMKGYK